MQALMRAECLRDSYTIDMIKRIGLTVLGLLLVFAVLAGLKFLQITDLIAAGEAQQFPPTVVTAATVERAEWETTLAAIGTLEAAQGVVVTADVPGRVTRLNFEGGENVEAGALLVEQETATETAELSAAESDLLLAESNLSRVSRLFRDRVVSRAELDSAQSVASAAQARVDSIASSLEKKQILAPFSGRLGLKLVDVGQDLAQGVAIVSLQRVDPMLVNFSMPQQSLAVIEPGLQVRVSTDAVPDRVFNGTITALDTQVNDVTRTVRVQATLDSTAAGDDYTLLPGMFARVEVVLPDTRSVTMVPLTSVSFATFGDSVFVLDEPPEPAEDAPPGPPPQAGPDGLSALQQFVQLGERRGDFVEVTRGLEPGQQVAKDGVFKLRNGAAIDITEEGATEPSLTPEPDNS